MHTAWLIEQEMLLVSALLWFQSLGLLGCCCSSLVRPPGREVLQAVARTAEQQEPSSDVMGLGTQLHLCSTQHMVCKAQWLDFNIGHSKQL